MAERTIKSLTNSERIKPAQEYDSLREELIQSKKYVFERPLIIVGVGAALITIESLEEYGIAMAAMLAGLLLFNFWFTINRLRSSARIIAYIYVVLEGDTEWLGWETSLKKLRIWMKYGNAPDPSDSIEARKTNMKQWKKDRTQLEKEELKKHAVPDALMFYPPIYTIHIALTILCFVGGLLILYHNPNLENIAAGILLTVIVLIFLQYCIKFRPGKMGSLIERFVIRWEYTLGIKNHVIKDAKQNLSE